MAENREYKSDVFSMLMEDKNNYIVIPIVSSENRRYIPMGFLDSDTIPTNQVQLVPDADIYSFGILESNVHMAWMRAVCGRLKSDYRYTPYRGDKGRDT